MAYGILLIRLVLGLSLAAHGTQKLFGWFGGGAPRGTAASFGQLRFRMPLLMALAAGSAEAVGGILFAAGLATPLAALAIAVVMLNAIASIHWRNGFWNTNGGLEYNLSILAVAVGVAATGPDRFSLDRLAGWDGRLSGLWWGVGVAAAAVAVSALTLGLGRTPSERPERRDRTRRRLTPSTRT
jgi:putative oxidoreductase